MVFNNKTNKTKRNIDGNIVKYITITIVIVVVILNVFNLLLFLVTID